jgi:hypothetical protein
MSKVRADNISNRADDGAPALTYGAEIPVGIAITGAGNINVGGAATISGNLNVGGTLTYEDVTNIDSVGIITAQSGIRVGAGESIGSDGAAVVYYGDGSNLDGVVSGVEIESGGSSVGTAITTINFQSGATVTASGAGSTITISAGVTTTAVSPTANAIHILGIGTAQHHTLSLSAGFSTITVTGGSVGDSHSVVLIQPSSGICTVGLSTFFQFPSGATPVFSEGSSKVDLISFVVKHVGAGGTELLTSAGLNYS